MTTRFLFLVVPCMLTAACSDYPGDANSERLAGGLDVREFSEADKRTARVLSIGSAPVDADTDNPYELAMSCSTAIEALAVRLEEIQLIDPAQRQVLDQARATYQREAEMLADQQGSPGDEQAGTLDEPPVDPPTAQVQMQRAIGCLRELL